MKSELIINANSKKIAFALLEEKKLVSLREEEKDDKFAVGNIFFARVKRILPSLNAAFLDIGYEKDAFLHYKNLGFKFKNFKKYLRLSIANHKLPDIEELKLESDIKKNESKISDEIYSGEYILVQISKKAISSKSIRLSADISIKGHHIILFPFSNKIYVSKKIENKIERERLKNIIHEIKPNNYGVIVRTVAEDISKIEIEKELKELVSSWKNIFEITKKIIPPKLIIGEEKQATSILRDLLNKSVEKIYVDNEKIFTEIKDFIKKIGRDENIVNYYKGKYNIFEFFDVEKQIRVLFGKKIYIKNGSYLIIEKTEAMHVIDVNSGNRSKKNIDQETNNFNINYIAVDEIARQLKLRDIGGIIVIDFIDMKNIEKRILIYNRMKEKMANDKTIHQILPLTKFGLMQITRQRIRPEISINVSEKCPICDGTGEIVPEVLASEDFKENLEKIIELKKKTFF